MQKYRQNQLYLFLEGVIMNSKKLTALILSVIMVFALTSCNGDKGEEIPTENTVNKITDISDDYTETESSADVGVINDAETTTSSSVDTETTTAVTTTVKTDDPSLWSKTKIVEVYKNAAAKSSSVTSKQVMSLADISINNGDGAINSMFKLIKPIITKVLESSSTEFDGITGGHQNILVSDVYDAKAYASGENTVIEMTMIEQVDGAKADRYSGTVGHAISVVGDVSEVLQMLSDAGLSVNVADDDVTLTYTEPMFKVLINKDGKIVNGTWSYLVDLNLANFSVGSVTVDNASAVIKYNITVNGGFSN